MKPAWWNRADRIHRGIVEYANNRRPVGDRYTPYSTRDAEMLALALAGEVGEIVQLFYKRVRDGLSGAVFGDRVREEIADARVYLELLDHCMGGSPEEVDKKLSEVMERWRAKGLEF